MGKMIQLQSMEYKNMEYSVSKEDYKMMMEHLSNQVSHLQRRCKELGVPVMILVDGVETAGKGVIISKLMKSLDPRGFRVYPIKEETKEEAARPFLWRFWTKTPEAGRITILENSWYSKVTSDVFNGKVDSSQVSFYKKEIEQFECQLVESGVCLIKFFLYIDKEEQKNRMKNLQSHSATAWRVTKSDKLQNKKFRKYEKLISSVLASNPDENAKWEVIPTYDKRRATIQAYEIVINRLERKIAEVLEEKQTQNHIETGNAYVGNKLQEIDLSKQISKEKYDKKLKKLQNRIELLHGELYQRKIPVVLALEGWDAGGKGGAIRRLTEKMDPRGYVVYPIASPTLEEKNHHYLWRFWKEIPKDGHIAIFDRTWYGRVMVERIEGFCSQIEWRRSYEEINEMEESLVNHGAIVLKFWLHIDKEEQKARFESRMDNPAKQWKITDEDWRNREKWDLYEEAIEEMLGRTSTKDAPWIIVEGNDKRYARIKVLQSVVEAMESRLIGEKR